MHGGGIRVSSTSVEFGAGALQPTRNPLDIAIDGDGFFEIENANGERFYTRSGRFHVDTEGYLAISNGMRLSAGIQMPQGAADVLISSAGEVSARLDGSEERAVLGSIDLVSFVSTEGLSHAGKTCSRQRTAPAKRFRWLRAATARENCSRVIWKQPTST